MRFTGNIWLEPDALVYDSLDAGQHNCPLDNSFSAAVQLYSAEQLLVKNTLTGI